MILIAVGPRRYWWWLLDCLNVPSPESREICEISLRGGLHIVWCNDPRAIENRLFNGVLPLIGADEKIVDQINAMARA